MIDYIIAHPEVIAALLSAVATAFAAFATWIGPRSAAKLAESLRRDGSSAEERHRLKLWVFTVVMQERAQIWSRDAVRALNLIDVVFKDSKDVREAWAELYLAYNEKKQIPAHVQEERLRALLRTMAEDMGLGDNLRLDDFGRVYYPNALAEVDAVGRLETQAALRRLAPQTSPTGNTAPNHISSMFPPRPSAEE
jgi:hypothetical protein